MAVLLYERLTEPVRHLHRLVDESHERWLPTKDFLDLLKVRPAAEEPPSAPASVLPTVRFEQVRSRYANPDQDTLPGEPGDSGLSLRGHRPDRAPAASLHWRG